MSLKMQLQGDLQAFRKPVKGVKSLLQAPGQTDIKSCPAVKAFVPHGKAEHILSLERTQIPVLSPRAAFPPYQVSELLEELQNIQELLFHQGQPDPLCLQHLQLHLQHFCLLHLLLQLPQPGPSHLHKTQQTHLQLSLSCPRIAKLSFAPFVVNGAHSRRFSWREGHFFNFEISGAVWKSVLCCCVQWELNHHWLQAGHSGHLNPKFILYFTLQYQHCSVSFLPFCIPVALHKAKLICVASAQPSLCLAAPVQQIICTFSGTRGCVCPWGRGNQLRNNLSTASPCFSPGIGMNFSFDPAWQLINQWSF